MTVVQGEPVNLSTNLFPSSDLDIYPVHEEKKHSFILTIIICNLLPSLYTTIQYKKYSCHFYSILLTKGALTLYPRHSVVVTHLISLGSQKDLWLLVLTHQMSVPQTNLGSLLDPVTKRNQEYNIQFIIVKSILKYTCK